MSKPNLVFTALLDGTVAAYDDTTLAELWKINVGSGFSAPPMTFEVNGKQYVAIASVQAESPRSGSSTRRNSGTCGKSPCFMCSDCETNVGS
jgi:glucose dehydrogenase